MPKPAPDPSNAPRRRASGGTSLGDLRFRALLGNDAWARLPAAVRARFSRKAADGRTLVFVGRVAETRMTRAGWMLAQLCRLIGGPLPTAREAGVPAVVTITEDFRREGQVWTRLYARRGGFPQVIHSSKRFAGPTGLEEHVGRGIGMTLRIAAEAQALVFLSERYFLELGRLRVYLPAWLTPGQLTVRHTPIEGDRFVFSLDIEHPRLGALLHPSAVFREIVE